MKKIQQVRSASVIRLEETARISGDKLVNPEVLRLHGGIRNEAEVLLVLAAGKGTRFGAEPKCIHAVHGAPLARHSIDSFRRFSPSPVICMVGYRWQEVSDALGPDNLHVRSDNPAGGTAFAAYEAFSVPGLLDVNPLLVITMGDRIVPPSIFRRLCAAHREGGREADLTFLTAEYEPPRNHGRGRVVRDGGGRAVRIVEERDILAQPDGGNRQALLDLTEGNCPLYAVRAATLMGHLQELTSDNAQRQFYLTDIVEAISRDGGEIRTITTTPADPEYDLLVSDVTRAMDLALLEGLLATSDGLLFGDEREVEAVADSIARDRPCGQVASIARQLEEMIATAEEELPFRSDQPLGIGISGGRLRIAFMHPDMMRFYGPAWQMPIGAGDESGREQIVMLAQEAENRRIHLLPMNPMYRESVNFIPSDDAVMYPTDDVSDLHAYEVFGTHMSESLLLSLGYFSDEELDHRRHENLPLPPASLWVSSNMRRPFALVGNAIASLRTLRSGNLGARVQEVLGRGRFRGLRLISTGSIPQGGFSSSSAVTLATKNAINALFDLGLPPDLLVHLACQAEYGTGVRAGSLDQATEQKGMAGQGTLISSNPRDNYCILGTYPVPTDRFQIIFPYSVERDRAAWRWSWGAYAESPAEGGALTAGEMRKMTGKAAEIAALLTRLPLEMDFFRQIETDLVGDGELSLESRGRIASLLRSLPMLIGREELRGRLESNRAWLEEQIAETQGIRGAEVQRKAASDIESMLTGWRDPVLRRSDADGQLVIERGVPLRAMMAYLFSEVVRNFRLINHPQEWIECVTWSQRGDRCVEIDPDRLPPREEMIRELEFERGTEGPIRLEAWLQRFEAVPFDHNLDLDDASLSSDPPPDFRSLRGGSFFRGLALIDLAEAMLKRTFGRDAVAVRVNAAGQGDFFQVHLDAQHAAVEDVRTFLRAAFYRRFDLAPRPEFVELHPGGGAVGIRLSRHDLLPRLVRQLRTLSVGAGQDSVAPEGPLIGDTDREKRSA